MNYQLRRSMKLKNLSTEAWNFCRNVRDLFLKLTPEVNPEVFTTKFGEKGIVIWTADFEDLNSLSNWLDRIQQNEEYQLLLQELPADTFDMNTWHDDVLHTF